MHWKTQNDEMRSALRTLNTANKEMAQGFGALSKAAQKGGVLDLKTKEFVALGIAIADRCDPCIGFHVDALSKTGATREELADMLGMVVQMGGGPSLMYAAKCLECWDQLTA
ncbi:carboxymuconolactone decarboxylase family protein [Pacificibacter marinus]|uniref:Carboxymuconolactone decarboxylase family protein n=1 Tax=Pacificibacter marinus TaxID=658057 RepID=A0A1Y5SCE8_9RHOB|nr:carboxymuconolactone decarboxylase family protein [Pacificibacter marinus]SEK50555.1 alkylhydroperoxidase AhpD family core domain-containing protein [Pacificibacter marinus]SLN37548.1 Carboxymuconolactone decarboxylase family protein [Pacificibacter marinus]